MSQDGNKRKQQTKTQTSKPGIEGNVFILIKDFYRDFHGDVFSALFLRSGIKQVGLYHCFDSTLKVPASGKYKHLKM